MFKKILSLALALVMCVGVTLALASCGSKSDLKGMSESPLPITEATADFTVPSDFKIGFIFLHDENSTYDKNFIDAANRMKTALGLSDDQVVKKTNIPESSACYDAAVDLANQGCKIIFADSFGHEDFIIQAAREYPNVEFCHATGVKAHTENLSNYHNAFASIYEGRYLAGIAAGMKLNEMISSGKITAEQAVIGYVGAFTYEEVLSGYTSFYLGAKSVCSSATMKVQYTGSWYDEAAEQEAAEALINAGCVLISQHADSMGAPSACEVNGVPNVSYNGSTYSACPETFIVSSAINWTPYFMYIAKCVSTNTAIAADWCGDISTGSIVLSGVNQDVAAEGTLEAIQAAIEAFKNGTLHVFDTSKFTVNGQTVNSYIANVDYDSAYTADTEVVSDGYVHESEYRSAPYFGLLIDGITELNQKY
jgi:basic membrane protein A